MIKKKMFVKVLFEILKIPVINVAPKDTGLECAVLARRPITLVLMMINSCSYSTMILCLISLRFMIKILVGI